jgi:hypothetical protein
MALFATGATRGRRQQVWHPVPSCLELWAMSAPRHGLPWLRVMLRRAHSHPMSEVELELLRLWWLEEVRSLC